ncbi:MAG TPA: hypothetical protein DCY13_00430 [Verrucomicrobiales bacterium]|nr:hypothetical protein [Verrucomicrobiales bacterium]
MTALSTFLRQWLALGIGVAALGLGSFIAGADPGELFFQRRAATVAKYDQNGDGRLNAGEREAARLGRQEDARRGGGRNQMFQMPPEIVALYDQDKDGQLNDEEGAAARDGIRQRWEQANKDYDKDGDGSLSESERNQMADDISAGKVEGLPRMFGMMARRPPPGAGGRGGGRFGGAAMPRESPLQKFDVDGDGRLGADELESARQAGAGKQPSQ